MIYAAASHQAAIQMFLLYFQGSLMSSIFIVQVMP